jgi:hypothetical protein
MLKKSHCPNTVHFVDLSPDQGLTFIIPKRGIPLEDAQGLMTRSRHYTKVALALQPPRIFSPVPQVMKSEFLYFGFFASGDKSFLREATERPAYVNTY